MVLCIFNVFYNSKIAVGSINMTGRFQMNCYYHPDTAGSASCHECGRTLCNICTDRFTPIMCEGCFTTVQSTER